MFASVRTLPMRITLKAGRQARIAFLNTHPIQYFAPLYAYLNASDDLNVSAIYLSDYSIRGARDAAFGQDVKWDIDLVAGYEAKFVDGFDKRNQMHGFFSAFAPELWRYLRGAELDLLVVHGHTPAAVLLGIAAAKAAGTAVFMRVDTHLGLVRPLFKAALRRPLIGLLYRCLDGVFAIGSANTTFYRAMGMPEERTFLMPYAVDNARFTSASEIGAARRAELRASLGVCDARPILLYAAKFERRKRPDDLLRAAAALKHEGISCQVTLIGSGQMEQELRGLAAQLELDNVCFAGFVNQRYLPEFYAACDIFVLPSENEPWGLAINEAMCAGLPVVASREIGCVPDLVHDGINGRTFAAGDIMQLADAVRSIVSDAALRQRMGKASRNIIARWSFVECGDGLRTALRSLGVMSDGERHGVAAR